MGDRIGKTDHLLDQATRCLARNPRATLNEVAAHSGVGIATLHRYFASREDLLQRIAQKALVLVEEAFNSVDLEEPDLKILFQNLAHRLIPLGDRIYFLMSESSTALGEGIERGEQDLLDKIEGVFRLGQIRGQVRMNLGPRWLSRAAYALLFAAWEEIHLGNLAPKEAAHVFTRTLLEGCLAIPQGNRAVPEGR